MLQGTCRARSRHEEGFIIEADFPLEARLGNMRALG
jgi:hypothetical protein